MADRNAGRCFCGAVEIEVLGEPEEMGYCHCSSCRSYTGGAAERLRIWKAENVRVTQGADLLGGFRKSEMSDPRFCTRCGGHVVTQHPTLRLTDVYAAVTSRTRGATRSQPRSLLSADMLKGARSQVVCHLEPDPDRPDVLRQEGRFWPMMRPLFQATRG